MFYITRLDELLARANTRLEVIIYTTISFIIS